MSEFPLFQYDNGSLSGNGGIKRGTFKIAEGKLCAYTVMHRIHKKFNASMAISSDHKFLL